MWCLIWVYRYQLGKTDLLILSKARAIIKAEVDCLNMLTEGKHKEVPLKNPTIYLTLYISINVAFIVG